MKLYEEYLGAIPQIEIVKKEELLSQISELMYLCRSKNLNFREFNEVVYIELVAKDIISVKDKITHKVA